MENLFKNFNIYDNGLCLVLLYGVAFLGIILIFSIGGEPKEKHYNLYGQESKYDYDSTQRGGCLGFIIVIVLTIAFLGIYLSK